MSHTPLAWGGIGHRNRYVLCSLVSDRGFNTQTVPGNEAFLSVHITCTCSYVYVSHALVSFPREQECRLEKAKATRKFVEEFLQKREEVGH